MRVNSISWTIVCAVALTLCGCVSGGPPRFKLFPFENLRGMLFTPPQVLANAQRDGLGEKPNAIVLAIDDSGSYRAAADAVTRVRERGIAVGYWIDIARLKDSENSEAQIACLRNLLANRPSVDAVFLAGLEGSPAACGCGSVECFGPDSNRAPIHRAATSVLIASVRTFAHGAIVVPAWLDGCAPHARECDARHCSDVDCERNATLAWNTLRGDSDRVALLLHGSESGESGVSDASARIAARLQTWMRMPAPTLPATRTARATLVAVLPSAELNADELARVVASVERLNRTGLLLDYTPMNSALPRN